MKGKKILLSLWLATAAFCLLQIVAGPNGFLVTAKLQDDAQRLDKRLSALAEDNARLQARFDALQSSSEAVRLEARRLGWFRAGEIPVKVMEGQGFHLPTKAPDFTLALPSATEAPAEVFFRLAWFLFVALFWGLLTLWDLLRDRELLPRGLIVRGRLDLFRH
ncbi:MAG: septum formation initiator family protein [Spirochaetales bacterium]